MSESKLTEELLRRLANEFEFRREVRGTHALSNDGVRIDLLAKARPHLISQGFTDEWFGIECKWADRIDGTTSKTTRMVWQCITYAQSHFEVDGERVLPKFVLAYTPDNLHTSIESHLKKLLELAHYGNVGRLYFYRDGNWGIKFVNIYASSGSNPVHINNSQMPKRRIGSV